MKCPESECCGKEYRYYLKFVVHMIREHNWNEDAATKYWNDKK